MMGSRGFRQIEVAIGAGEYRTVRVVRGDDLIGIEREAVDVERDAVIEDAGAGSEDGGKPLLSGEKTRPARGPTRQASVTSCCSTRTPTLRETFELKIH